MKTTKVEGIERLIAKERDNAAETQKAIDEASIGFLDNPGDAELHATIAHLKAEKKTYEDKIENLQEVLQAAVAVDEAAAAHREAERLRAEAATAFALLEERVKVAGHAVRFAEGLAQALVAIGELNRKASRRMHAAGHGGKERTLGLNFDMVSAHIAAIFERAGLESRQFDYISFNTPSDSRLASYDCELDARKGLDRARHELRDLLKPANKPVSK